MVLTTKHHDGFCLYPSRYTHFNAFEQGPKRDLVGELTAVVRAEGLRMGTYYSGLLDWTTFPDPLTRGIGDNYNQSAAFADYSRNQVMELIERYQPSVLWNDIGWPEKGRDDLPQLFAHYFHAVPEGVVNDRWSVDFCDYTTAEYQEEGAVLSIRSGRCGRFGALIRLQSQNEDEKTIMSGRDLVRILVEYVSTMESADQYRTAWRWDDSRYTERPIVVSGCLDENKLRAIYGTRPWAETARQTWKTVRMFSIPVREQTCLQSWIIYHRAQTRSSFRFWKIHCLLRCRMIIRL